MHPYCYEIFSSANKTLLNHAFCGLKTLDFYAHSHILHNTEIEFVVVFNKYR
jgi:hypothetical protein